MPSKPLTNAAVQAAKPREKAYKLADGQGMYPVVKPTGAKYWRLKYRIEGNERLAALGGRRATPSKTRSAPGSTRPMRNAA